MSEHGIEYFINETLTGETQRNALELAAYLRTSEMSLERQTIGYWADKIYFICNYKGESVCYIAINEFDDGAWYITFDDSGTNWFEDFPLDEQTKEIVWKNVDICESYCGGCGNPDGGTPKKIFGKEFDKVCLVTMKFENPNAEEVECMKKLFEVRRNYILKNS